MLIKFIKKSTENVTRCQEFLEICTPLENRDIIIRESKY